MSTGVNGNRTYRWLAGLLGALTLLAAALAPSAAAETSIGDVGQPLRVNYKGLVADITVHNVLPSDEPPGWTWNGTPRWRNQGGPWKSDVTVHVISTPNPYWMASNVTFTGVTPFADAYASKHTDDPNALELKLLNAPAGSTVDGVVYWDVYRGLVSNVVMLNPATGTHLAQWNLWQPGTPIP